jgi:membrane protein YqaA with SNARE-associated domain
LETFFRHLFRLAYRGGALGLFAVGVLDSSFLMLPLGNDFLLLGLSARHPARVPLYVAAATIGSVCGVLLTLWLSSKAGDRLAKGRKGRAWKYAERQTREKAGWALTLGSLMPPPFPFTIFVAAAGALKVPLKKVLPFVGAGRLLRFTIEGLLAVHYGRWILSLANSPILKYFAIAMIVIAMCGSAYSIYGWMKK